MKITVSALVAAPIDKVWRAYSAPEDIQQWNAASADWHTTSATVDLRVGGTFSSRMEARDGSVGFDFAGTYTLVDPPHRLSYTFGDRSADVSFVPGALGVTVTITFDAESAHPEEAQREGWQSVLDNFARHVVARHRAH
jgi:uncharacterized protein YndB with AHSA1/START domain